MSSEERLFRENAALVALLNTIDKTKDTWNSIADKVERQGSAVDVFRHEVDPSHHKLYEDGDENDYETGALLDADDVPVSESRKADLNRSLSKAEDEVREWKDQGLDFVSVLDGRYPNRLREVVDMPPFLFSSGTLKQDDLGVSVVGSRKASKEALDFASDVSAMLVGKGLTVIAGLAAGIDAAAHRRALQEGGRTVAFVGTGITKYYPAENRALQEEIERQGEVLSQFWPWQGPTRYSFPMRNASMSGYGIATVVVEASEYSGTRIQARQAQHHGRPIILRDKVVHETEWAKKLIGKPGVYEVSTVEEVGKRLDDINGTDSLLEKVMQEMVQNYKTSAHTDPTK